MIRYLTLAMYAAMSLATAAATAQAQTAAPVTNLAAPTNILFAKDVPVVPMAEWEIVQKGAAEQTGARILIAAGDEELARVPKDAVRYDSQTFRFPTGTLRVLTFKKENGGVLHQITSETLLYVVKGSATVGVAGVETKIGTGDVVNLPSGVLRNSKRKGEDTTILAFTVANPKPDAKAAVVRAKDNKPSPLTAGPKADTAKVSVQRYNFDGNSIRVARLVAPGKTGEVKPGVDVLVYMVSGRMQITVGDETKDVMAGDVLREEAGKPTYWDVYEDSVFVATNAPFLGAAAP